MSDLRRFVNDPEKVVEDELNGYLLVHGDQVRRSERNARVLVNRQRNPHRKVALISGGGSGHEPAFLGYLGKGYLDAVAVGEVFASPPADAFLDAALEANIDGEVIALIGNYAGDVMNMKMAAAKAGRQNVRIHILTSKDDIASAPKEEIDRRYGMAAGFFTWRFAGYLADQGLDAEEIVARVENLSNSIRSIVVGLSSLEIPSAGKENFVVPEGKMEFGIGHHGEAAIDTPELMSANMIGKKMTEALLNDYALERSTSFVAMISGLGATPPMEQYIMADAVNQAFKTLNHSLSKVYVGNFITSLNMNGISLTLVPAESQLESSLETPYQPNEFKTF